MKRKLLLVMVVALLVSAGRAGQDADKQDKDEKKIVGAWVIVSGEKGGEKVPEEKFKEDKLVFGADGKIIHQRPGKEMELTFKLNPAKTPKEIDVTESENEVHKGIYVLDKDSLKICVAHAPDERPTEFATQAGTKTFLLLLKRAEK
jgi:uncharacterized protein (TIGR03067 family)